MSRAQAGEEMAGSMKLPSAVVAVLGLESRAIQPEEEAEATRPELKVLTILSVAPQERQHRRRRRRMWSSRWRG